MKFKETDTANVFKIDNCSYCSEKAEHFVLMTENTFLSKSVWGRFVCEKHRLSLTKSKIDI